MSISQNKQSKHSYFMSLALTGVLKNIQDINCGTKQGVQIETKVDTSLDSSEDKNIFWGDRWNFCG